MSELAFEFTLLDEEGEEIDYAVPGKHAVCPNCEGHGMHLRPGMREHAYTREEFDEAFHDEEDRAEYFKRGGIYDVTCETCGGRRVVVVADESKMGFVQTKFWKEWQRQERERLRSEAEDRRTMARESGEW